MFFAKFSYFNFPSEGSDTSDRTKRDPSDTCRNYEELNEIIDLIILMVCIFFSRCSQVESKGIIKYPPSFFLNFLHSYVTYSLLLITYI